MDRGRYEKLVKEWSPDSLLFKSILDEMKKREKLRVKCLRKIFLHKFRVPLGCHAGCGVLTMGHIPSTGDSYNIMVYYFNGQPFAREFTRTTDTWATEWYITTL